MLKYGLLGGGMMGREHIQNVALVDGAEITAIAEPNQEMQSKCLGLVPNAAMTSNLDELLKQDIDALVIATPNFQHADQLIQVMGHKPIPILVEKPLVTEPEDIKRIADAAGQHPAPIWVAMEYRYMPPLAEFRQRLTDVGELQTLSIREHRFRF